MLAITRHLKSLFGQDCVSANDVIARRVLFCSMMAESVVIYVVTTKLLGLCLSWSSSRVVTTSMFVRLCDISRFHFNARNLPTFIAYHESRNVHPLLTINSGCNYAQIIGFL